MRTPLFIIVFISLPIFGASCFKEKAEATEDSLPAAAVETIRAEESVETISRRYTGFSYPWESHGVGFLVAGRVTSINVKQGDYVKKGQLIATIAPEDYALVKRLAEIQTGALHPNLERVDALVKEKVLPPAQLDEIKGKYEAALTQKEQAERQLNYTRLYAPCNGVVKETPTSVGQVIGAGMPAVILLDMDRMKLKIGVTQKDLILFKIGDETTIDFAGVDAARPGKIIHIEYVADSLTRTYDVVIETSNADGLLRASMVGHVRATVEEIKGFFVPLYSIKRDEKGEPAIMLVEEKEQRAVMRKVKIGKTIGEKAHIEEGLTGGELVIVKGHEFINAGDRVKIK